MRNLQGLRMLPVIVASQPNRTKIMTNPMMKKMDLLTRNQREGWLMLPVRYPRYEGVSGARQEAKKVRKPAAYAIRN